MTHKYQSLGANPDRKQWWALYLAAAEAVAQGYRVRVIMTTRRYCWRSTTTSLKSGAGGAGSWQFGNWENPLADDTEYVIFADFLKEEPA